MAHSGVHRYNLDRGMVIVDQEHHPGLHFFSIKARETGVQQHAQITAQPEILLQPSTEVKLEHVPYIDPYKPGIRKGIPISYFLVKMQGTGYFSEL